MLDAVHDIQTSYRKVIDSMARPGSISNLVDEVKKWEGVSPCFPSTLLLARMLLDTEVSFKVFSNQERPITRFLHQLTYAKAVDTKHADFIFLLDDAPSGSLQLAVQEAKIGELMNPHTSATIIVETNALSNEAVLSLRGPGIQEVSFVKVDVSEEWIAIRTDKNKEYPLGIDLIFVDREHQLLCLPRTTQVIKEGR
ncbi:phosphonate C-P lyase system protein PhnH [Ectobacillus polymachus]|uniref:phosphonate C-P lyase system protein PhnH n=1 Tax=Ectobacillus polymachus TaxID=1508806 RepID=UPI003A8868A9